MSFSQTSRIKGNSQFVIVTTDTVRCEEFTKKLLSGYDTVMRDPSNPKIDVESLEEESIPVLEQAYQDELKKYGERGFDYALHLKVTNGALIKVVLAEDINKKILVQKVSAIKGQMENEEDIRKFLTYFNKSLSLSTRNNTWVKLVSHEAKRVVNSLSREAGKIGFPLTNLFQGDKWENYSSNHSLLVDLSISIGFGGLEFHRLVDAMHLYCKKIYPLQYASTRALAELEIFLRDEMSKSEDITDELVKEIMTKAEEAMMASENLKPATLPNNKPITIK